MQGDFISRLELKASSFLSSGPEDSLLLVPISFTRHWQQVHKLQGELYRLKGRL